MVLYYVWRQWNNIQMGSTFNILKHLLSIHKKMALLIVLQKVKLKKKFHKIYTQTDENL